MKQPFEFECIRCKNVVTIMANPDDMQAWKDGQLIQRAMPYLSDNEREIMVSKICGPCFDKIFS